MNYLFELFVIFYVNCCFVRALSLQNLFNGTLSTYIDSTSFKNWTSTDISCMNSCGASKLLCFCDVNCEKFGDCCYDYWKYCSNLNTIATDAFDNTSTIIRNTQDQYNSFVKMGFPDKLLSVLVDGYHRSYFRGCSVKVNSKCNPMYSTNILNYTLYESLCLGQSIPAEQLYAYEVFLAYYDTNTSIIYKNYYCAKCNGIPDGNIVQVDKLFICKNPWFDAFVDGEQELSLKNMYKNCNMTYLPPSQSAKYRSFDSFKDNFFTCNQTLSFRTMAVMRNIFNGYTFNSTEFQLQSGFCDIYMMPINMSITYQGMVFINNVFFKNIHCFQCWMLRNSFSLDFLNNTYSNISGMYSSVGSYNVYLTYFDSTVYQSVLDDASINYQYNTYRTLKNISYVYTIVNRVKSILNANDETFVVKNMSKILKRIDPKHRASDIALVSSYSRSLVESETDALNVTSSYEFILNVTIVLGNSYLNTTGISTNQQIVDLIMTNVTQKLIKRFNLSSLIYSGPSYTVFEVADENAKYANISMNLRFNVKNVALLNMKINSIFVILRHLSIFRDFFLTGYNSDIDKIFMYKNTSNTENFKQWTTKLGFIPDIEVADDKFEDTLYTWTELVRLNALKVFMPYNANKNTYLTSYHIDLSTRSNGLDGAVVILNLQYDPSIESDLKSVYNFRKQYCEDSFDLYALNNTVKLASVVNNELNIVFNYSGYAYNFKLSKFDSLSNNIYIICVDGATDEGRNMSNLLDQLISIKDAIPNKANTSFFHRDKIAAIIFVVIGVTIFTRNNKF